MSQKSEISLVKLKPRASSMFFPTLLLAGVSFALTFFAQQLAPELYQYALWLGLGLVSLFWFFPLIGFMASKVELTNQRLIHRFGFLGLRKRQLFLNELSSIEIQRPRALRSKVISILLVDGSELVLSGYARTKLLAAEIEALAKNAI